MPPTPHLANRLTRNTAVKLASELIGRAAMFGLVIVAARQLGEAGFGIYNYGLALGFVLAQLADLGLQIVIAREVAVQGQAARALARTAFQLKVIFSLVVVALLGAVALTQSPALRPALLLLGVMQVGQTFLEFAAYIYRGQQRLWAEAWLLGGARVTTAVIGVIILWRGGTVGQLAAGSLLAVVVAAVVGTTSLRREGWLRELVTSPDEGWAAYQRLLREAAPLGIAIFLSIAYTRSAILLLQIRLGETAVAHYSAAARLVEPTQILPASLMAAVFPAISLAMARNPHQARRLGLRVSLLLGGCGLLLASAFWLAAGWLAPWLYGDVYAPAVPVLQLLGLTVVPAFINYSLTHYLIARQQQLYLGWFTAVMLGLHLGLSWMLIGRFGVIGPAISTLISEGFLLVACLFVLVRKIHVNVTVK
jgi:O-antigen/teichoic acid export membrane protein